MSTTTQAIKKVPAAATTALWAIFRLGEERLALSVDDVQEVLLAQPLTPVPLAPPHISGLINLRGQIVPAVELRRCLGFPARTDERASSFLVVRVQGELLALMVDEIGDVLELPAADWRPPPETLEPTHRSWVFAICPTEEGVVLGLELEALSAGAAAAV